MAQNITKGQVVGFAYHLKNEEGETLEVSSEPLEYLHGYRNLIPGLERELEGMKLGERKTVVIPPSEAYGEYDENLVYQVSRDNFPPGEDITPGMQFRANTEEGSVSLFVQEVSGETVIMNGNHPLAGLTLNFDIEIHSIRPATPEELENGYVLPESY